MTGQERRRKGSERAVEAGGWLQLAGFVTFYSPNTRKQTHTHIHTYLCIARECNLEVFISAVEKKIEQLLMTPAGKD